jgi:nicotinamide-nucleotide amidase
MNIHALAAELVALCTARHLTVTTAESCTGGLVAGAITGIPGASAIFTHGFVTYANIAKTGLLGVPPELFPAFGAVSPEVAAAMAAGAQTRAHSNLAIAITGIAGPGGGTPEKPVGTVWFGLANGSRVTTHHQLFTGERDAIREASVAFALTQLLRAGGTKP